MACARDFYDAMEALNSYGDFMVQEEFEFLIGSHRGKYILTIRFAWKISNFGLMAS